MSFGNTDGWVWMSDGLPDGARITNGRAGVAEATALAVDGDTVGALDGDRESNSSEEVEHDDQSS
jgi:hypothetical protein